MLTQIFQISEQASLKTYLWEKSEELAVSSRPAVLVIPGGGYMMCSDREAEPVALAYAAEGFQTFVLRYTVMQGFEPPFAEAKKALALIRERADEWNVAADKIVVCGFSAGGHLACALGTMPENCPAAMVLGYPAVLRSFWVKAGFDIPDMVERVNGETSPAFIMACMDDPAVPIENEIALADALRKNNIPFECHIYAKGGHGFSLAKKLTSSGDSSMVNPRAEGWFALSVSWIKETVGDICMAQQKKLPEGVAPAIHQKISLLLDNAKTKAVLLKYSTAFENETIVRLVSEASLSDFILSLGLTAEQIISLSFELEAIVKNI